jgi:hypothetical protein
MGAHPVTIRKVGSVGCVAGGGGRIAREKIPVGKERRLGGQQCGAVRFAIIYTRAPAAAHWKTNEPGLNVQLTKRCSGILAAAAQGAACSFQAAGAPMRCCCEVAWSGWGGRRCSQTLLLWRLLVGERMWVTAAESAGE